MKLVTEFMGHPIKKYDVQIGAIRFNSIFKNGKTDIGTWHTDNAIMQILTLCNMNEN